MWGWIALGILELFLRRSHTPRTPANNTSFSLLSLLLFFFSSLFGLNNLYRLVGIPSQVLLLVQASREERLSSTTSRLNEPTGHQPAKPDLFFFYLCIFFACSQASKQQAGSVAPAQL